MERSVLAKILADIPGVEGKKDTHQVAPTLRLDVHVGGRALSFSDVVKLELEGAYLRLTTREDETVHYVDYDSLVGLSTKNAARTERRAGFS